MAVAFGAYLIEDSLGDRHLLFGERTLDLKSIVVDQQCGRGTIRRVDTGDASFETADLLFGGVAPRLEVRDVRRVGAHRGLGGRELDVERDQFPAQFCDVAGDRAGSVERIDTRLRIAIAR